MTGSPTASRPAHDDRNTRLALLLGLPLVIAAVAYVPFLAFRSDLPERVASHFGASGRPDGSMTITSFLMATGVLMAVGVGLCIATAVARPSEGALAATGGFLGGFLGGMGAGILAATSVAQRGLDDWRDASGAGWLLLVVLVVATALGAIGARLAINLDIDAAAPSGGDAPVLDLAAGERAVFVAASRSTAMFIAGVCSVVVAVIIAVGSNVATALIVAVAAVLLLMLSTVRVRADRTGLRVRYGLLPWPSTLVPIDRLARASVIDVRPAEWGGWGYRGSLKLARRAAVVHRAGPGIRCDLTDGGIFVVTVDHPETAVAVLNAQVARASAAAS